MDNLRERAGPTGSLLFGLSAQPVSDQQRDALMQEMTMAPHDNNTLLTSRDVSGSTANLSSS